MILGVIRVLLGASLIDARHGGFCLARRVIELPDSVLTVFNI